MHYDLEKNPTLTSFDPKYQIVREGDGVYLEMEVSEEMLKAVPVINSHELGCPRICECSYEDPEGQNISFTSDLNDQNREGQMIAGPLTNLKVGHNKIKLLDL